MLKLYETSTHDIINVFSEVSEHLIDYQTVCVFVVFGVWSLCVLIGVWYVCICVCVLWCVCFCAGVCWYMCVNVSCVLTWAKLCALCVYCVYYVYVLVYARYVYMGMYCVVALSVWCMLCACAVCMLCFSLDISCQYKTSVCKHNYLWSIKKRFCCYIDIISWKNNQRGINFN